MIVTDTHGNTTYCGGWGMKQQAGWLVGVLLVCAAIYSTPAQTAEIKDPPILRRGQSGEAVVVLQKALAKLGLYKESVSGTFDVATQSSVKKFQQRVYIPMTGQVDPITWRNLKEAIHNYPLVIGYYGSGGVYDSFPVLQERSQLLTAIAPVWFWVENDGRVLGDIDPAAMEFARRQGVRQLALVSNLRYDTTTSKMQVRSILNQEDLGKTVIRNIIMLVERFGFTGINLDFEYIRPEDRDKYSQFVRRLGLELKARNRWFTISVAAKTADRDFAYGFNGGFDYRTLGQAADHLILMAYDRHYAGGPPGPVAPLDWVKQVVTYARSRVDPRKIVLGINAYGYDWHTTGSSARAIVMRNVSEWAEARGATLYWDPVARVPYARYSSGGIEREAWLENAQSIGRKMDLVGTYGIAGLAWWRMGYEDHTFWDTLHARWPYPYGWSWT